MRRESLIRRNLGRRFDRFKRNRGALREATIMTDKNAQLVIDAAARGTSAVLSLPSAGMIRNHKSRLVTQTADGLLMQAPGGDQPLIGELVRTQTPCLVSFRSGIHKVNFAAPIVRADVPWKLNEQTTVSALLLAFPTKIIVTQKRADYRVRIPPSADTTLRVWRISPEADLRPKPSRDCELAAKIVDLSTGGVGLTLSGEDGKPPRVSLEDRLRIEICYEGNSLLVEGKLRQPAVAQNGPTLTTGIKFKVLEQTLEGRRQHAQLVSMVGELQRLEVRMSRMGLMQSA
jgi:hypothetical protein